MVVEYSPVYSQPFRSIYKILSILSLLLRFPLWTAASLLPSWRPRPTWSLKKTVMVRYFRWATNIVFRTGSLLPEPNSSKLEPNSNGVWVPPISRDALAEPVASWAVKAKITPTRIPGYWYFKGIGNQNVGAPDRASRGNRVVYCLHGGGYVIFSAHPSSPTATIYRDLLAHTDFDRAFLLEYRLTSHDGRQSVNPFPTALIDAISGYHYLTDAMGYSPEEIVIAGDSAGGHLALNLVRYIRGTTPTQLPSQLILFSPWVDFAREYVEDLRKYRQTDMTCDADTNDWLTNAVACLVDDLPGSDLTTNPYLSPVSRTFQSEEPLFKGFPPTFITLGAVEQLSGSQRALVEIMRRDMGQDAVESYEGKDCIHDYLLFDWEDESERRKTYEAISQWSRSS